MPRKNNPNGSCPITLSLDKKLVETLQALPSGERSQRVNEVLVANAVLLGMDRREQERLHQEYVRLRFLPLILKEARSALDQLARLSDRELREILQGDGK